MLELRAAVLVVLLVATALQAGLYYAFACAVLPGLARGEDQTHVATMTQVNAAILNPAFLATFVGAPLLGVVAALLPGPGRGWVVAAAVLALLTLLVTVVRNVPLNDALAAGRGTAAERRRAFAPWARWNTVRALASTASVACTGLALLAS